METDTYLDTTTSRPSESSDVGNKPDALQFKQLRKSRKLSQQWVADKCECSNSLISKWEKGAYSPSGEIMRRIARTASEIEELPIPSLKYCWKCQTQKQVSLFGRDMSRPNGLQSRCLKCNHAVTNAWRKANKNTFADRKRVKYKINTSGSRQAGYKWVNGDKRSLQEIQLLGAKDELSLRKTPFRCSPIKKTEKRMEAKLLETANQLLASNLEYDNSEECSTDSYLDFYSRRIKQKFDSGRITKFQGERLARHIACRSPYALEQYWKTNDVSILNFQT